MRIFLFVVFISFGSYLKAQKIYGTVFTSQGDLLPYSTITIKGTSQGAAANNKGRYALSVKPGSYTLVCQHVGFQKAEKTVIVGNDAVEASFVLNDQKLELKEVIVQRKGEDPAYEIIRNAIKKRNYYNNQVKGFDCELYTKDIIKLRSLPNKIFGQKVPDEDRRDMGLDSSGQGIIYLSESIAKIYTEQPDKFKMEVISSRVSGSGGFGFTFPSFISFYENNVKVFSERLNPRGFVSPIAEGALHYYKYKYLGSFEEDGKLVNSIRVTPRRAYEPLFTGTINITENDWRIHSLDLSLSKTSQLELLDTLQVTQIHVPATNDVWRVKDQLLHFNFKQFGIDAIGNFLHVYSDYHINPVFSKNVFNNVIIRYDTAVNKRSKEYWDTMRPVPLEAEEKKDYQVKDSLYQFERDSALSQRNIDSLRKRQGPLKLTQVLWKGVNRTRYHKTRLFQWGMDPLIQKLEYNTVEGAVINANLYISRYLKKARSTIRFEPHIRYGFSNNHLNAWARLSIRKNERSYDKKSKRHTFYAEGGKRVSQFYAESMITPLQNSINTLFWGDNFLKIYENWFGKIGFNKAYESGFRFGLSALYEDRIHLDNTSKFTVFKKDSVNITPNYPYEQLTAQVPNHQAFILSIDLSIRPGQKFIQFPNTRIAIGSKFPLFSFNYTKGISGVLGSDVNFDKWRFTISDDKNLKLLGALKYKLGVGGFLNNKQVYMQDYQHFNGNRSTAASEYVNSFQLAKYYANSTTANFYSLGHVEHHFNGLLTNKIPLFKRLNWNLVAGSNAFYVNQNNNYMEVFAGLENILKVFRVDFVTGYQNGNKALTGIRIGRGGLIGGAMSTNGRSVSLSF